MEAFWRATTNEADKEVDLPTDSPRQCLWHLLAVHSVPERLRARQLSLMTPHTYWHKGGKNWVQQLSFWAAELPELRSLLCGSELHSTNMKANAARRH